MSVDSAGAVIPNEKNDSIRVSGARDRVAAVVVTRNRKELLCRCLDALLAQTRRPDHVIVVDNASSDGTEAFPVGRGRYQRDEIVWVHLAENVGGAGGFHEGMHGALVWGADFIWLMDDDGVPAPGCLDQLLESYEEENLRDCILGPLVISEQNPDDLAFTIPPGKRGHIPISTFAAATANGVSLVRGWAAFFNGILLPRRVVEAIGLPKAELFIWGDEVEYFRRAKANGIDVHTVLAARHIHPPDRTRWRRVIFHWSALDCHEKNIREYCLHRNAGYITRKYSRTKGLFHFLLYSAFYLVTMHGNWQGWYFFANAFLKGWFGNFAIPACFADAIR